MHKGSIKFNSSFRGKLIREKSFSVSNVSAHISRYYGYIEETDILSTFQLSNCLKTYEDFADDNFLLSDLCQDCDNFIWCHPSCRPFCTFTQEEILSDENNSLIKRKLKEELLELENQNKLSSQQDDIINNNGIINNNSNIKKNSYKNQKNSYLIFMNYTSSNNFIVNKKNKLITKNGFCVECLRNKFVCYIDSHPINSDSKIPQHLPTLSNDSHSSKEDSYLTPECTENNSDNIATIRRFTNTFPNILSRRSTTSSLPSNTSTLDKNIISSIPFSESKSTSNPNNASVAPSKGVSNTNSTNIDSSIISNPSPSSPNYLNYLKLFTLLSYSKKNKVQNLDNLKENDIEKNTKSPENNINHPMRLLSTSRSSETFDSLNQAPIISSAPPSFFDRFFCMKKKIINEQLNIPRKRSIISYDYKRVILPEDSENESLHHDINSCILFFVRFCIYFRVFFLFILPISAAIFVLFYFFLVPLIVGFAT